MEVLDRLGAEHLRSVVVAYRDALRAHQAALNSLNVYPVPDGDTGTNMALTLESVVAELDGAPAAPAPRSGTQPARPERIDMGEICRAISHGSLMGARGNSGVILSQLLRGLTDGMKDVDSVDGPRLADALDAASQAAYRAVLRPVEGTILTVAREAAEAAVARRDGELVEVLDAAAEAGRAALERTPELLAVLAEAGVVDAGGAGFVLLLDVLLHVTAGRPVPEQAVTEETAEAPAFLSRQAAHDVAERGGNGEGGGGGPRYEVMFLLDGPEDAVEGMKQVWGDLGDSIVVVGGDGTWNCHVHTDDIGAAIEAGVEAGRPYRIRVTDLHEQVEELCHRDDHPSPPTAGEAGRRQVEAPVATAVVAVAAGEGVERILRSLGVQRVVTGGQSANPSTAELLAAVDGAPGKEVVLLPNNKNVVPVAEQVTGVTSRPVRVLPTVNVSQAFAALLAYDADADAEANVRAMTEAVAGVSTGEVTQAVREATTAAGPVRKGDWLGVTAQGIAVVEPDPADAACALLDRLVSDGHEIVTLVEGGPATAETTRRITEWLGANRPGVEVEVHPGGQPLSAYLLSCE
ncbi:MAG TPA: DAK2 domain-containing protein [Acidimicrobiales bacterium]|nr:DAK2 domain-containing protein [Acidimicrobiales bacterium]